ncbi:MAG TPA: PEP-CTERM sorting domain-containing protein [Tepidisphaeraceae bacterium]|jgi:hypothetical protein|nr:PEP-CTERM sorting domain-containing protein [Tepidisphaeraceae bacterium]
MNRKSVSLLAIAALALTIGSTAHAALLISDTFDYTNGSLAGNTPTTGGKWAAHSGTTNDIQVVSGAAVVNEATGVQDDNSTFAGGVTATTGSVLYSSYTVNVSAPTGTLAPVYFGMFLNGTSNFTSRVSIAAPATAGDGYRIALSQGSSTTAAGVILTADLAFGTTYTIATSYDYTNKNGSLWLNPVDTSSAPLGTTTDSGFSDAVGAYAFRQSSATGNSSITIDNLKVGTTFADVVPEPSTLSLLGLGALSIIRRRKSR